ncbi:MAG: SoxXA-binding protein [Candidatus Thiodiazotropha sp. (ex Monitilora ramsayi)]|nr:SoxXA-binding protein [Candidatus Thiodiazotropha sp. (ex Monitilora ramsayi)]
MHKKLILLFTLLAAIAFGGTTTTLLADEASAAKVQKLIDAAEAARKEAASVNGEWRDTAKMIKKAKAKLAKGDYVGAAKLANEAAKQGHLGYEQAMSQKELKMPSYLHY